MSIPVLLRVGFQFTGGCFWDVTKSYSQYRGATTFQVQQHNGLDRQRTDVH